MIGKYKREGGAEYPALQQVASLEKSQLQASVRYALSSHRSLLLLLLTLLGFCLAFVRILHEVLGAAGAVVAGLIAGGVLYWRIFARCMYPITGMAMWCFFEIPKP